MNEETDREVFRLASEAKAHLNGLQGLSEVESTAANEYIKKIRKNLELIERRSDPARNPEYDPRTEATDRAEIEHEAELDRRRERHFDRHGHF